ncbi:MAG: hypothetical protein U7126_07885 [Microcoleus sp.]
MNDLTAEGAEGTEEERRELNNYDASGFELTHKWGKQTGKRKIITNSPFPILDSPCPIFIK